MQNIQHFDLPEDDAKIGIIPNGNDTEEEGFNLDLSHFSISLNPLDQNQKDSPLNASTMMVITNWETFDGLHGKNKRTTVAVLIQIVFRVGKIQSEIQMADLL